MIDPAFQGSLFSNDFLCDSIAGLSEWTTFDDAAANALAADLAGMFQRFPVAGRPNESQTEDDLIWAVLRRLGWNHSLRNQNLTLRGRDDVPDGLLFESAEAKAVANSFHEEWKRYEFGLAIVESKRWGRPLDRQSGSRGEETAPSTQMLRYLRRVDDITGGKLRWGMLTNGGRWRLYYQGARSVSEQFFEIDLAAFLSAPGHDGGLFALTDENRAHWLKVFALMFRREAFVPSPADRRTFHQIALDQGRFYVERVASDLSKLVFGFIFPTLVQSIAAAAPAAPLDEVRDAALILLYRLLFILYAEDRGLLPVNDRRYDQYSLRTQVRGEIGRRKDHADVLSPTAARYWSVLEELCRAINDGDKTIGLPPYNGGLFDPNKTPLLTQIRLGDAVMAEVIDNLSFEKSETGRKYINYRDLGVQQLGSIYERLLERRLTREDGEIRVQPNIFARKSAGGYYTPDDLVNLIIRETIDPLVSARMETFRARAKVLETNDLPVDIRLGDLTTIDPAEMLLEAKICDPAMGSGHFLVSLVDYLTDRVISAMVDAEGEVPFGDYVSPLFARIRAIRARILRNAGERGWTLDYDQLDDRHIVRRMVLKRCVYGVDKNPMAVELAKVALWLHTFTVGAPLSFLDHHLRCGDSLFGSWVRKGIDKATALGSSLFLHEPLRRTVRAAANMQRIEGLSDAEIAEANLSKSVFEEVCEMTAPLDALLSFIHGLDWLDLREPEDKAAIAEFLTGQYGDPVLLAMGKQRPKLNAGRPSGDRAGMKKQLPPGIVFGRFEQIWARVQELVSEERFLNWQVVFPGVWSNWEDETLSGGFDAIIGNPPWDRVKFQKIEWFEERDLSIAKAQTAAERKLLIGRLERANAPLFRDYARAAKRAETMSRIARKGGEYPYLSGGDTNLNSLFIERAQTLIKSIGRVGLLVPSGIVSDQSSSSFFKHMMQASRICSVMDFFNRKYDGTLYFPDVYYRFKFCAYASGGSALNFPSTQFGFFLRDVNEIRDPNRVFPMSANEIFGINPNSGTAPIFRSRRDLAMTAEIYRCFPVLCNRSMDVPAAAWPVQYASMLHMANDSELFFDPAALDRAGAYPVSGNLWKRGDATYYPLYEGKMVQAYDHRAADITLAQGNLFRPGQGDDLTLADHRDPNRLPLPRYWIDGTKIEWAAPTKWCLAIKDVTSVTNARTFIACLIPFSGSGHTLPLIVPSNSSYSTYIETAFYLIANFNSVILDYLARQKVHGNHLAWYLIEQLPVVGKDRYLRTRFGPKSAADMVRAAVLELTYTAHDMAPFARDMGYVDDAGELRPPFNWDEDRRLKLRAKLDAIYFHLYGVTDRDDVRYIYSTFPIVEREEMAAFNRYRSRDLCLAYMNALAAGDPDAEIDL